MNKILAFTTLSAALLLSGCSKSTAFDFFATDVYYEKAVSNMQKASLMQAMETKALLHAVYLNNVDPDLYQDGEYFYVAVHIIEDAYDPKKHGLRNLNYQLKLIEVSEDDKTKLVSFEPIETIELDEDDKLRRTMPIQNQWNHYYRIKFKTTESKTIKLSFGNDRYGKIPLVFQKEK